MDEAEALKVLKTTHEILVLFNTLPLQQQMAMVESLARLVLAANLEDRKKAVEARG